MSTNATTGYSGSYHPLNTMPIGQLTGLAGAGKMHVADELTHLSGRGMSIRIVPANGGTIVSIRDENNIAQASDLYIIHESQDIAQELGKILTLHYLKT